MNKNSIEQSKYTAMLSFWEKRNFLKYDYIIIGSGIVGLSTALSIRERSPLTSILVIERGFLPTGASTKNAGFACIGSLTEILEDLKVMSPDKVLELVALRLAGLNRLRKRLGDKNIGYAENGSYEIITESELQALSQLSYVNELLRPLLHCDAYSIADHKISQFGFNSHMVRSLIENNLEGELDTGLMMKSLMKRCMEENISINTGTEVIRVIEENNEVKIFIDHKYLAQHSTLSCTQVAICTNAFTEKLIPGLDIQPGRGQVLITQPVEGLKVKGIFHFDKGYYYFREVEGRILFGGGRNKDFEGERKDSMEYNELILADLVDKLNTIILPATLHEVDYAWTGIMAFGKDKFPIIKKQSPNIYLGVRMGGMGVAIGSEVGDQLAAMMISDQ